MKNLIKTSILLGFYLCLPFTLIAINTFENNTEITSNFEQLDSSDTPIVKVIKVMPRKLRVSSENANKATSLTFPATSITPVTDTGADFVDVSSINGPFTAIEMPDITVVTDPANNGPTVTIPITIPAEYNKKLRSFIQIGFITEPAIAPIIGDVGFSIKALITRSGNNQPSSSLILRTPIESDIESAPPTTLDSVPFNAYSLRVDTTGLVQAGDVLILSISRDNSVTDNFGASIFILGLGLVYNIDPNVRVNARER